MTTDHSPGAPEAEPVDAPDSVTGTTAATGTPRIDEPEVDGPEVDGPEVDGPEVDGPEVDGPEVVGPEGGAAADGFPTQADGAPREATVRSAWPGVLVRAVVVLAVAGLGYQSVVPVTSTARIRLARLAITRSGVPAYGTGPGTRAERPATTGGVSALEAAAKAHPSETGLYVVSWSAKSAASNGSALAVVLLPDRATASRARDQLAASQLSAKAFTSSGLVRTGTFTPAGVAGASGSLYATTKGATSQGKVAITVWQSGRVVALVETAENSGTPQTVTTTVAAAEAAHLNTVVPGFTLSVTHRPALASALWAAGSLAVLVLVAGGPVGWRRRRAKQERLRQEELARTIRVGGSTIVRKRREV